MQASNTVESEISSQQIKLLLTELQTININSPILIGDLN